MAEPPLLKRARQIAAEVLAPQATAADQAAGVPAAQIRCLADAGLLGITTPAAHGGQGAPLEVVRDCLAAVARGCGVTAFVYIQHVAGCRIVSECGNEPLKKQVLPDLARGKRFLS